MTKNSSHPARTPEFLSRLHDGDLTPGERAHFESHRAHCAECRGSAAEFEEALSLYRRSSPSPASPDLAARILRKLQASSRRRDPYGIVFGINLKWAGAFAAALVAMIIGSSVVLRQQAAREETASGSAPPASIPVTLESKDKEEALRSEGTADDQPKALRRPAEKKADEGRANPVEAQAHAPEPPQAPAPAPPEQERRFRDLMQQKEQDPDKLANVAPSARMEETMAKRAPATPEDAGGERNASASSGFVAGEPSVIAAPVIRISSLDGHGAPPDRLGPAPELSAELRGREYVLVVDSQGTVYDARLHPARQKTRADEKAAAAADAVEPAIPESLKRLRFKPSDRPRRLLLRIE